jgi:hypothetical protein
MNRWQTLFLEHYYGGKMPQDKRGLKQLSLLENVGDEVTVHFPRFEGVNGVKEAHDVTYRVTENRCNMKEGIISAVVLSWQMLMWDKNGYKIDSVSAENRRTA